MVQVVQVRRLLEFRNDNKLCNALIQRYEAYTAICATNKTNRNSLNRTMDSKRVVASGSY